MQTRLQSLLESTLNIGSGFFISLMVWQYVVCPLWGISFGMSSNLAITGVFTVVSVIRSYLWRRAFNWWQHKRKRASYG